MKSDMFSIRGNIVDIYHERIFTGEVCVLGKQLSDVKEIHPHESAGLPYILPGFIDSHVHVESSMLVPSEFARLASVHGTIATVSDPHEIANVCGVEGVKFMIENGKHTNFKFHFGAPSCVPATKFETAGATIDADDVEDLLNNEEILYLSEMMNFPGVISDDESVIKKIASAHRHSKPVDGHAPGLRGEALMKYIAAGISTDHECFTRGEALEKLALGMKILIREGSAAKNFDALIDLLHDYPSEIMFCSDDKHPDSLVKGHVNDLCSRAVGAGITVFNVLKAACINPVIHYRLPVGTLRKGDAADFIVVEDLQRFRVLNTYINGELVAAEGKSLLPSKPVNPINYFEAAPVRADQLRHDVSNLAADGTIPVIEALDGQLITNKLSAKPKIETDNIVSDTTSDILKIVVLNRYQTQPPAVALIKNFGLKDGAIASSVAHDSHNVIATGTSDDAIAEAINLVVEARGGISVVTGQTKKVLPLPVAGLMSSADGYQVAASYTEMDQLAKTAGSTLSAPFMTLSFMALLVIPSLKLSDKGLFDGNKFNFVYQ